MDKRKYFSEQWAFRPGWVEAEPVAMLGIVENNVTTGCWKGKGTSGSLLWTASIPCTHQFYCAFSSIPGCCRCRVGSKPERCSSVAAVLVLGILSLFKQSIKITGGTLANPTFWDFNTLSVGGSSMSLFYNVVSVLLMPR